MTTELAWQEAYKWLCQQRKNAPADSDVWHLRFHWAAEGAAFRERVEQGKYRLKPMRVVNRVADEPVAMWDADDALVLKWVALQIQQDMPVHAKCHHVKGTGVHYSRREVKTALDSGEYKFVYRTDIRGYYRHMQKDQLNALVEKWVKDPVLLDLTKQYIAYSVEDGGEFHTPVNGISRGCALSPMIGASLLVHVDELFDEKKDLFYVRYMDDFLVLSKKRWPLRRAIRVLNEQMNAGGFTLHPDKTQIGRVEKGFDWLGLWFDVSGVRRSPRSLQMRANKILRLYERLRPTAGRFSLVRNIPKIKSASAAVLGLAFCSPLCHAVVVDLGTITLEGNTSVGSETIFYLDTINARSGLRMDTSLDKGSYSTVCSKVLPGFSYQSVSVTGSDGKPVYALYNQNSNVDSDFAGGSTLSGLGWGNSTSFCSGSGGKKGPFSEQLGILVQTDRSTGQVLSSTPIELVGTIVNASCSVNNVNVPRGDLPIQTTGKILTAQEFSLSISCGARHAGFGAPLVVFSSAHTDGSFFMPGDDIGLGLQIESNGVIVRPGGSVRSFF